jgi:hypothetical protein
MNHCFQEINFCQKTINLCLARVGARVDRFFFFEIHTVPRRRSEHARILTPMNTRTQTLPL